MENDAEKMEEICANFTKSLITNKFDDLNQYLELLKRTQQIISTEMKWRENRKTIVDKVLESIFRPWVN